MATIQLEPWRADLPVCGRGPSRDRGRGFYLTQLWTEYRRTGSLRARNLLAEAYMKRVDGVAMRVAARTGADAEDLRGEGYVGLIDAVTKFDPSRGVRFGTYADLRIRGAMLDDLRYMDWVPRLTRTRVRQGMDITIKFMLPLEGPIGRDASGQEYTRADIQPGPDLNPADGDRVERILDALPGRLRAIVRLYALEGLTMAEVGKRIGRSESRVGQLMNEVRDRVRDWLEVRGG